MGDEVRRNGAGGGKRGDDEPVELYRRYRPKLLKHVVGQPEAVSMINEWLKNKRVPAAVLLVGPSGCGKTTLARILKDKLGCSDMDFDEINAASDRGIDMVRKLETAARLAPMAGPCRVWIIDECFHRGTDVTTPSGPVKIADVRVGDVVTNVAGSGVVERVFVNKVSVDRVVKVTLGTGVTIFTTKDHLFLTDKGWVPASGLSYEHCLFSADSYDAGKEGVPNETSSGVRCLQHKFYPEDETAKDLFAEVRLRAESPALRHELDGAEAQTGSSGELCVLRAGIQAIVSGRENRTEHMLLERVRNESAGTAEGERTAGHDSLSAVRHGVRGANPEQTEVLQQGVRRSRVGWTATSPRCEGGAGLSRVFGGVSCACVCETDVLQQVVSGEEQDQPARDPCETVRAIISCENQRQAESVHADGRGFATTAEIVEADAGGQSRTTSRECDQGDGDKRSRRHRTCLVGSAWGERETNPGADGTAPSAGRGCVRVENGITDFDWTSLVRQVGIPDELQSRCRMRGEEGSSGDRRRWAQIEEDFRARCQKDAKARTVRVARVEVYQRGRNERAFVGVISNQDNARGFVEFYDLQISEHPSYFANGVAVHNCHELSHRKGGSAQTALLKVLEDTPRNVYFFLATTHPNELLDTIRTRCTIVHVHRIAPDLLANHVADVARREGREVSQEVLDRIVECADGSARKALVLLHQVFGLGTEAEQLAAITKSDTRRQAFDIVKALLWERTTWADMCKILRNVEDEPEQIRRLVLANAGKEILKAGKSAARARMILSAFECDFFASGREGLYGACWDVLMPAP